MAKRRKLQDLYITGREVEVTGPNGSEVVWIQKVTSVEQEAILRKANAARARVLMYRNDRDSEEYQSQYSEVADFGDRDFLISYLIQNDLNELRASREAELAAEEKWATDNYLEGLRDAWEGTDDTDGLKQVWLKDPDDPEASRVYRVLKEFAEEADKLIEPEAEFLKKQYEDVADEEVMHKVVCQFLESKADSAWMRESARSEVFYAVRLQEDHTKQYFESRSEVDLLHPDVLGQLARAYQELRVDPVEGKGSAGTGDSSLSSEESAPEETEPSSGLQVVTP